MSIFAFIFKENYGFSVSRSERGPVGGVPSPPPSGGLRWLGGVRNPLLDTRRDCPPQTLYPTCRTAIKALLCPFYLVGKNKAEVDGRRMTLLDMVLCPSEYSTRQQIRAKYSMEVSIRPRTCVRACLYVILSV